jgi:hypothetical protein
MDGTAADLGASATPQQAAAQQLDARMGSVEWRTKVLSGDGPATAEMQALIAAKHEGADQLDQIIAGTAVVPQIETTAGGALSIAKQMSTAVWLRELGIEPGAVRQLLGNEEVGIEEFAAAKAMKADLLSNPDFVRRYLAGSREEIRKMTLLGIILSSGIKEAA